jgi:HK97 gp10 family phage protein
MARKVINAGDAIVEFRSRTPEARVKIAAAVLQATRDSFLSDMVPDAKRHSPVLTGHNADTIDATVVEGPKGIEAKMFTESGYGGYLETGTRHMPARPYLWPAFASNVDRLKLKIRELLRRG